MKVAVIGPICKDEIIIKGKRYSQLGGVTYYAGEALASLGAEVVIFGSFGKEKGDWLKGLKSKVNRIKGKGTLRFINEYPEDNMGIRKQRAEVYDNRVKVKDLAGYDLVGNDSGRFDYIVLGPLFHDNISKGLIKSLKREGVRLVLSGQGVIRYLKGDKIVWKRPEKVWEMLGLIDYLFLDEGELKFIGQRDEVKEAINFLRGKGARNIVVTQSERGSLLFLGDKRYEIKAFPPRRLVDPTGAGDSYLAGFVKALELFEEPLKQGEFAAMTATISLERKGLFKGKVGEVYGRLGWRRK